MLWQIDDTNNFTHILRISSPMPFTLVRSSLVSTNGGVAILLRQATPFRLMDLPLHIRTKILRYTLKHDRPNISIVMKPSERRPWSPGYKAKNSLAVLAASKQLHTEAAPIVYNHTFEFPGTPVATDFLLRIGSHRRFLTSLRSDTYTSQSARTLFHLLTEAKHLHCLSFAHMSSSETPKQAIKTIWGDAMEWLMSVDKNDPTKGLEVLVFDEQAFHVRERDRETGLVKILQWGPAEQLEFLRGLSGKMVAEGRKKKKSE
jgi:hypothetical protein